MKKQILILTMMILGATQTFAAKGLPTTTEQFKKEFVHDSGLDYSSGDDLEIPKEYLGGKVHGLDRVAYPGQLIAQLKALETQSKALCKTETNSDKEAECDFSLTDKKDKYSDVRVIYTNGGFITPDDCAWCGHKDVVVFTINGKEWYTLKAGGVVTSFQVNQNSDDNNLFIFASIIQSGGGPLTVTAVKSERNTDKILQYAPAQVLSDKIFGQQ